MASLWDFLTPGNGGGLLGNLQPPQQQPQPQQSPDQGGGFGNFLGNNALTLMALGGGIAQGGIGRGLTAAVPAAQYEQGQRKQDQAQQSIYQALLQANVPEPHARMAALNPEGFKALAPEIFGAPKVVKTGTDILGHDIMKLQQGTKFSEIPGQSNASSSGVPTSIDQNKPIYAQLPKPHQDVVDQMLAGKKAPPGAIALKTPYWQTLMAAASEKAAENGGMFDETTWGQRFAAAKDLAPQGRSGKTINALDTVQGHIGDKLIPAIDKLEKSGIAPDWPVANWFQNTAAGIAPSLMKERTQALTAFNNARKAVVDEMGNAYKAGHLTDAEVKDWSALVSNADSIIKLRQAAADFVDLLNTKRQATINQYKGLDVPFKGANEEENQRVTKLAHDRNAGIQANSSTAASPQDKQALDWANSNPTDPRASAIKKKLGIQ